MLVNVAVQATGGAVANATSANADFKSSPVHGGFFDLVNGVLKSVSATQSAATLTEAGYAAGIPGATLSKALVASDRAQVAWSATVAVRNEVVSAYQTIMNMQF